MTLFRLLTFVREDCLPPPFFANIKIFNHVIYCVKMFLIWKCNSFQIPAVVGSVVSALLLVGVIAGTILYCKAKKRRRKVRSPSFNQAYRAYGSWYGNRSNQVSPKIPHISVHEESESTRSTADQSQHSAEQMVCSYIPQFFVRSFCIAQLNVTVDMHFERPSVTLRISI